MLKGGMVVADLKKLYSVKELLAICPISRAALYSAIKRGEISSIAIGRRLFIPSWVVDNMLNPPHGVGK